MPEMRVENVHAIYNFILQNDKTFARCKEQRTSSAWCWRCYWVARTAFLFFCLLRTGCVFWKSRGQRSHYNGRSLVHELFIAVQTYIHTHMLWWASIEMANGKHKTQKTKSFGIKTAQQNQKWLWWVVWWCAAALGPLFNLFWFSITFYTCVNRHFTDIVCVSVQRFWRQTKKKLCQWPQQIHFSSGCHRKDHIYSLFVVIEFTASEEMCIGHAYVHSIALHFNSLLMYSDRLRWYKQHQLITPLLNQLATRSTGKKIGWMGKNRYQRQEWSMEEHLEAY